MDNLLSIVTFLPLLGALILALFLRGDDEAAQRNAKWVALWATAATFVFSIFILLVLMRRTRTFSLLKNTRG